MEKKYLKISLSSAILIAIIFLLIIVILALSIYFNKNNFNNVDNDMIQNYNETNKNITNTSQSNIENSNIDNTIELDRNNSTIKNLLDTISFPTYAIASIYNVSSFDLNSIPNDLILRLGWSKIDNQDKITDTTHNPFTQTVSSETLKNSITNIFGPNLKYTDASFKNIDIPTFNDYFENQEVSYSNNTYTSDYVQGGGGEAPFIYQELQKAIKTGNKIQLFIKTAFIDTVYDENTNEFNYVIYKNFNTKFEDKLIETDSSTFTQNYSDGEYNNTIFTKSNSVISPISDKLTTYIYTFEFDDTTQKYYFSSFYIDK